MKSKLYAVQAMIEDSESPGGLRGIWYFHAVSATSEIHAINECRSVMERIMKSLPVYIWKAKLEWEDNMAVN